MTPIHEKKGTGPFFVGLSLFVLSFKKEKDYPLFLKKGICPFFTSLFYFSKKAWN